jgi:hypothetical protein
MSATNRGSKRSENDYYSTPPWAVDIILPHLNIDINSSRGILSPAAGKGEIISRIVNKYGFNSVFVEGLEIDQERALEAQKTCIGAVLCCDALVQMKKWGTRTDLQLIIDNPPYLLVDDYAKCCLELAGYGTSEYNNTTVALLTNVSFLFGIGREKFWKKYPADLYLLPKRPSFFSKWTWNDKKKKLVKVSNDATNYVWVVWNNNSSGKWTRLDL